MKRFYAGMLISLLAVLISTGSVYAQGGGEELVFNGDFGVRHNGWEPVIGADCNNCTLQIQPGDTDPNYRLFWDRTGSQRNGNAMFARQVIDHDVSDFTSLQLDLTFMITHHSLTNSGWWSDQHDGSGEYPFKVTLRFYDEQEHLFEWHYGFLATHDGSTTLANYSLVSPNEWHDYHVDLFSPAVWTDAQGQPLPRAAVLHEITLGGSGWDFGGALKFVSVTGYPGSGSSGDSGDNAEEDNASDSGSDSTDTGDQSGGTMGDTTDSDTSDSTDTGGQDGQTGAEIGAFIVEMYELVPSTQDNPVHFEFRDYVPPAVLDVRRAWREPDPMIQVNAINAVMMPWGYLLQLNPITTAYPTYTLLYQGNPLLTDITAIWPLAVNASETDFRLIVASFSQMTLIVTPVTVGQIEMTTLAYIAPVYVGDDYVQVFADWDAQQFHVMRNGERIYTVIPDGLFVEPPVKALWSWQGQWVLEVEGDIVINGVSLNDQQGCSESFGWRLIAGQPFYFFRQGDQLMMSYAGEVVEPYRYDEVVHYRCCEEAIFNLQGNASMAWFYALQDGIWYYVEAGVYDE